MRQWQQLLRSQSGMMGSPLVSSHWASRAGKPGWFAFSNGLLSAFLRMGFQGPSAAVSGGSPVGGIFQVEVVVGLVEGGCCVCVCLEGGVVEIGPQW